MVNIARHKHKYLLSLLLLLIVVEPFISNAMLDDILFEGFFALVLLFGVTSNTYKLFRLHRLNLLFVLVIPVVCMRWWGLFTEKELVSAVALLIYVAFLLISVLLILSTLMSPDTRITTDTICGAFAVYLIIGIIWAILFVLLEMWVPGSFDLPTASQENGLQRLMGFSLATLTTVGYGNVAPATAGADAVALIEAVVGQIYIAVIIARLVSIQVMQSTKQSE
ncbi:MAG: hypothetical protein CSA09_04025 [Candidatus Contendobacter odensis]|uniref:Potassium channel domain-containing protein n=1 Tax=Candidatus Contendibacter odensensis TaxID=1400860 RepID=A0A2G6PEH1_9GAMM|nr:MAG: hypothetical protein CSA09_04025 [Candidatus Contendobacter odensis]